MLYIIGDLHGHLENFDLNKFSKDDIILQLGDAGIVWKNSDEENKRIDKFSDNFKGLLICVLGNHDNHYVIKNVLKTKKLFNAKCYEVRKNIYYIMNGEVLIIDNKKFISLGGALSIDRHLRIDGIDWWQNEQMNYYERYLALKNLTKYSIDYILSHTAPTFIVENYFKKLPECIDSTTDFLEYVNKNYKFKHWYFGHFHVDEIFEDKYECIYTKIKEIK